MKIAVIHLVDSRNENKALEYMDKILIQSSSDFIHIFSFCGNPEFKLPPFRWDTRLHFIEHKSKFISDWVKDSILWLNKSGIEYDFLQIRDWDDTYEMDSNSLGSLIKGEVSDDIGMITCNYKVRYHPDGTIPEVNPYGTFVPDVIDGLPDVESAPFLIHRQFKLLSKKLVNKLPYVMDCESYPKLSTLDDTLLLPICYIECYLNELKIMSGVNSDMIFEVLPTSDTHKDELGVRYYKAIDAYIKDYGFISDYYSMPISYDINLSEFIFKCLRDRSTKTLFSIGYHKVNK